MYPHERSLVEKMQGRPFALVGVNSDKDRDKLRSRLEEERITWPSFWNGPEGTGGPISAKWNVHGWPTLYVIDHRGVIQHKWLGSPGNEKLDEAIEALVAVAEGEGDGAGSGAGAATGSTDAAAKKQTEKVPPGAGGRNGADAPKRED